MSPLIRALIPFMRVSTLIHNYLPKAPPTDTITLEIRASTYEFGGGGEHKHSVHNRLLKCMLSFPIALDGGGI